MTWPKQYQNEPKSQSAERTKSTPVASTSAATAADRKFRNVLHISSDTSVKFEKQRLFGGEGRTGAGRHLVRNELNGLALKGVRQEWTRRIDMCKRRRTSTEKAKFNSAQLHSTAFLCVSLCVSVCLHVRVGRCLSLWLLAFVWYYCQKRKKIHSHSHTHTHSAFILHFTDRRVVKTSVTCHSLLHMWHIQ